MGYKTTGKPLGQDQIDAAVVYAIATNRLDYTGRQMRHVVVTANTVASGATSCRLKVIVNANSDTVGEIQALFAGAAVAGEWHYWDPKEGAYDISLDEDGGTAGGTGVALHAHRIRTIDFLPVADSAGKGATAACAMEIKAIPSR